MSTEENKAVKYLAICVTFMVCVTRLSMAAGQAANGIALLLAGYLWYKYKNTVSLTDEVRGYIKAYGVFVLLTIPSILFSADPKTGIREFFNLWVWRYVVFIAIVFFIKRRDYLVNMLTAFLLVTGVDSLLTLVQVMGHMSKDGRGWGFGSNVLTLAGVLCMLLPVALVILMDDGFEKRLKKAALFSTVGMIIGLLCNKSRGAWLTELIVVPVVVLSYVRKSAKYLLIFLIVAGGIAGYMSQSPQYVKRFQAIVYSKRDRSVADRYLVWKSTRRMIRNHPVVGVGLGQFRKLYMKKYKYRRERQNLPHSHNNFLQITAETGAVGAAGLLYFIGYCLVTSMRNFLRKRNPYDILVFTTVLGYLCLFGQIEYTLDNSSGMRIMWFLLANLLQMKEISRVCSG